MGPTDRNKSITPGLLSSFGTAPRAVSVRAVTERAVVAKTRSMTRRVSTNEGFIPIRTARKPRSEAHPALNPIRAVLEIIANMENIINKL